MSAAVQDVHHRNRKTVAVYAAQETIQGNLQCGCCCSAACDGYSQDRISAQVGFILGSVCFQHCCIYCINIRSIHAFQHVVDDSVDIVHCLGYSFSSKTFFISITQLQSLELTGGCSAGSSSSSDGAVCQINFRLNGGIASGINDLSSDYFFNG